MIRVFLEAGLPSTQFFEMSLSRLLQALFEGVQTLPVLLNGMPAKGLPFRVGGKVDDAQVNAERIRRVERLRRGNVQRHGKKERPVATGLSFLPWLKP